ncbi:MAG: GNAT family N-acetyltransferase [Nocardioides sp.]
MLMRRARPEEYATIGELTLAAYEPFLLGPEDIYRARLADTATRDAEAEVWVATEDGPDATVLGAVTICAPGSHWREIAREGEGEFRMLAVDPTVRGRGVGRALATMVIDRFRLEGDRRVVLSSLDMMRDAHRLYERLGFARAPERDWRPQPGVSLIVYTLELT